VNGLLIVDKPAGMTSHDVVARVRRCTGEKSVGHLGTLDPMATGVLPLMLGKFTRLAQYFAQSDKSYTGAIRLGFATDTYDAEGQPDGPDRWPQYRSGVTLGRIRAMARRFRGEMDQMPPAYSAKKIEGKPAYKLAREGKPVDLKPAKVHISSFEITSLADAEAEFTLTISAGGYVRSIAHELGEDLECGAHLSRLRRTRAGAFSLDAAHTLDELEKHAGDPSAMQSLRVHPRLLLPEMPAVTADDHVLGRFRNGAQANLPEFSDAPMVKVFVDQEDLMGIAKRIAGTLFQPVVVMQ
jgi:tRNA pseudouridine55 synthase